MSGGHRVRYRVDKICQSKNLLNKHLVGKIRVKGTSKNDVVGVNFDM